MSFLTDEERRQGKQIYEVLPEAEKAAIEQERKRISEKYLELSNQKIEELKKAGEWLGGLDGDCPELKELHKQYEMELENLMRKIISTNGKI